MKDKIRVLHYIPGFLYGGIETLFLSWYRIIDHEKVEFELLLRTQDDDCDALKAYRSMGGKYYRIAPLKCKGGLKGFKVSVGKFFSEHHDYDILHAHGVDPFIFQYAKKYGVKKIILHSHTTRIDGSGVVPELRHKIENHIGKKYADYGFACSKKAAVWRFGSTRVRGRNVEIIRNAIDCQKFRFSEEVRSRIREELNLDDNKVIGFVGRLTTPKNPLFIIEIFAAVNKQDPSYRLMIVGDGADLVPMQEKADELGVTDSILFLGARADVPELMCAMDCFLLPSIWEGFPVTLVEAQANGLPCFISDVVTEEADITHSIMRLSIKEEPEVWAEKICNSQKVVRDDRRNYNNVVVQEFDVEKETEILLDKYKQLISVEKV